MGAHQVAARQHDGQIVTADNLADQDPPYQLYERDTYDAIGRRFTIGFRKKF